MKSVSGFASLAATTVPRSIVSPMLDYHGAVGLLGQFARFDLDLASVGQRDDLADCVVQLLFFHKNLNL